MYQGKYQKPVPMKKHSSKRSILVISLVLLLVAVVGGTVAYLMDATNPVENTFSPAKVQIIPNESKTETSKSNITFTNPKVDENGNNLNTVPVYIRATLVIYWTDTFDATDDGKDNPTENIIPKPAGNDYRVDGGTVLTGNGWFEVDGVYYYAEPVAPGDSTKVMLDTITVTIPYGSTAKCYIDVRAEAIQADPESVVGQVWTDVEVVDGKLAKRQEVAG